MPQPLRVLMLGDRPAAASLWTNELQRWGFTPTLEQTNGERGLVAKLDEPWDVVIADGDAPRFEARHVLRTLRELDVDLPVVVVSAAAGGELMVTAANDGTSDQLQKTKLGSLGDVVRDALAQRRRRREQSLAEQTLHERSRLIRLSGDVGLALSRSNTRRDMLQRCCQSLVVNLDAAFARVWTLSPDERVLELQASAGMYTHLDGPHSRIAYGELKIGWIAQERKPHLTNDLSNDPRVSDPAWAKREGLVAFAGYPLIVEERVVGVMAMFSRQPLTETATHAMASVANQIAAGIERKRMEEKLQFTQFTIDHIGTPIYWTDEAGRFFNVNNAACHMTGYSREELLSMAVGDVDPNVTEESWNVVWRELQKRRTLTFESSARCHDGRTIPVRVSSNLLQAEGREFSCTFLQDITEQREAQENQRKLATERDKLLQRLQLQIARMPLGYLLFDADLRVVDWNPAAERIFGYSKEEMLGMGPPFKKILPDGARESVNEILRRVRTGDMAAHGLNENLTKDGRTIICEWINTPLISEDGSFSGLLSLVHDITERRRLEEQFRQSQKLEAIGRLAGGVAHDFNNMLTIILGYSDMLKQGLRLHDPLHELVHQIEDAGKRAATLTRQLLAFSRKQMLAPASVDLNALVMDMKKMFVRLIGEDIELRLSLAPELWPVQVDAASMEQAIVNLVVNGRDAMPHGGTLTITTSNVSLEAQLIADDASARTGEHVLLTVNDTGCGMDNSTSARIFEPFFTTKGDQGTGLGLPMVYGIVKQSGGDIDIWSEPGRGTTFRIYLPRAREGAVAASPAGSVNGHVAGTETILLAEDEDGVRTLARLSLQRLGYMVLEARHGGEALLMCEQHSGPIDLLVTDVIMPQMSGRELAERLAAMRPEMKVLFMSGYTDDAIVREGLVHAGMSFLQKPFAPEAIARKVREVLDAVPAMV